MLVNIALDKISTGTVIHVLDDAELCLNVEPHQGHYRVKLLVSVRNRPSNLISATTEDDLRWNNIRFKYTIWDYCEGMPEDELKSAIEKSVTSVKFFLTIYGLYADVYFGLAFYRFTVWLYKEDGAIKGIGLEEVMKVFALEGLVIFAMRRRLEEVKENLKYPPD